MKENIQSTIKSRSPVNPARIVFLSFILTILLGAVLLYLPISCSPNSKISFIDALYTSTSAVCVTGLIVKDTPKDFSLFGQIVIITLIQIGGLGIMTFSLLFIALFSKKFSVKSTVLASNITGYSHFEETTNLIKYVVMFTFGVEFIGILLLFIRFMDFFSIRTALYHSVFHSISAFCNAGFSSFSNNLSDYREDVWINLVIMSLIIIGGIGFVVVYELQKYFKSRDLKVNHKISLHTRLALITTGTLIITGAMFIFIFEYSNLLRNYDISTKALASLFQSITCRTAGFNTIDIANLSKSSALISIILMFIGGSPASCAGGIKTTTFAVLFLTLIAMIRDNDEVEVYGKRLSKTLINKSVAIFSLYFLIIIIVTAIILFIERRTFVNDAFLKILFETVSAIGTVGLSMDVTNRLSDLSKIIYICVMFLGRVGPLTITIALVAKDQKIKYRLPEDKVLIG